MHLCCYCHCRYCHICQCIEFVCLIQSALSSMHLSRLHSSTRAPVTASVLLRRSSSRRLLPTPQEDTTPTPERRPSVIGTIPETIATERRSMFRRRNVMSLVGKKYNLKFSNIKEFTSFNQYSSKTKCTEDHIVHQKMKLAQIGVLEVTVKVKSSVWFSKV